jgi:hypothetical protein
MNVLIMCSNNEIGHVAACQGQSSIPTNAKLPLHRGHVHTNLAVAPLHTSIQSPTTTYQLVVFALQRMTWQVHSWCCASQKRLKLGNTARIPKGDPDIDRYTQLYLSIYLTVYISICTYICTCNNGVCLHT